MKKTKSGSPARDLVRILQASPEELTEALHGERLSLVVDGYARVVLAFMRNDVPALRQALQWVEHARLDASEQKILSALGVLRMQIREGKVSDAAIRVARAACKDQKLWEGEAAFVCAMAEEARGETATSKRGYEKASELLERDQLPQKALKAAFNAVAMESALDPDSKYLLSHYTDLLHRALRARSSSLAGTILTALSWEWQRLGALSLALRSGERALKLLSKEMDGPNALQTLAHVACIEIEMGLFNRVKERLELLEASDAEHIRQACAVLRFGLDAHARITDGDLKRFHPGWRDRYLRIARARAGEVDQKEALTPQENKLILLLSRKPRTASELQRALFGDSGSAASLRVRLDAVLKRLRKRIPDMLENRQGRYLLRDIR
jgi:hypothetical protein